MVIAIDRKDDGSIWVRNMHTGEWIAQVSSIEQAKRLIAVIQEME